MPRPKQEKSETEEMIITLSEEEGSSESFEKYHSNMVKNKTSNEKQLFKKADSMPQEKSSEKKIKKITKKQKHQFEIEKIIDKRQKG